MFNTIDSNSVLLGKDPDGAWIVGPVVGRKKLLGYLSADNHVNKGQVVNDGRKKVRVCTEIPQPAEVESFQLSAIDLATDLLAPLMLYEEFPKPMMRLSAAKQAKTRRP